LSLSIQPSQKIGIYGRSGSGKSSLLATLFRLLEIESQSRILIDGVEIARIPRQTTRTALNAIPQKPLFTHGTVRANIDPSNTNSLEDIERALRRVELWDVVETKRGFDAPLDANFLSHGQRQLFCLGRALLRKSKIVILDEMSSNVDIVSDALMQRVLREEFADCTILAVAHRLETMLDFDRIAMIQNGELIEFDTPEVLLKTDSAFKGLYES
jgi:ABC-type multidrug transport system fused ATPase/permease subunit